MGIANHFIHKCDIQRPSSSSDDAHGLSDESRSIVYSNVRFRLVEKRERNWKSDESESAVVTTYTGLFGPGVDLVERDELVNVTLENGVELDEKFVIKSLLVRRSRAAHHLSVELQRIS